MSIRLDWYMYMFSLSWLLNVAFQLVLLTFSNFNSSINKRTGIHQKMSPSLYNLSLGNVETPM